jgi:hypothetical protein
MPIHGDVAIGAIRRALSTADAVVFDHDLERAGMILARLAMVFFDANCCRSVLQDYSVFRCPIC